MQKDPGATQGQPGGDEQAQPAETATQETPGNTEETGGQPEAGE